MVDVVASNDGITMGVIHPVALMQVRIAGADKGFVEFDDSQIDKISQKADIPVAALKNLRDKINKVAESLSLNGKPNLAVNYDSMRGGLELVLQRSDFRSDFRGQCPKFITGIFEQASFEVSKEQSSAMNISGVVYDAYKLSYAP